VAEVVSDHWATYGRDYYSRHDFENVPSDQANALMSALRAKLANLAGQTIGGLEVAVADEFSYNDPVDGSVSKNQGVRIGLKGGGRAVFRLSGTGTQGATLRLYLEQYSGESGDITQDTQTALKDVRKAAIEVSEMQALIGRIEPDVIS
jgi:phosphoglucomutase